MLIGNFEIALYLITNIFKTYTYKIFLDNFLIKRKLSRKMTFLAYAAYFALNSTIFFVKNLPINVMLSNLILVFILCNVYTASFKNKIIFSVLLVALGVITEDITGYIISFYANTTINIAISSMPLFITGMILSKIILFIVIKIICKLFGKANNHDIPMEYWFAIFTVPVGSVFIVHIMLVQNQNSNQQISLLTVIAIAVLLVINFLIFYLYERMIKLNNIAMQNAMLATQNELFVQQYKIMETSQIEIHRLRHDLKGHLLAILSFGKEDKIPSVTSYIEGLLGKIESSDVISDCGIAAIDGIINPKLNEARQLGAEINADILILESIEFDPIDLTIILSNILDNAIEACKTVDGSNRFIDVHINYDKKNLFIEVSNSCKESLIVQNGESFKSTKKHTANRPHGLGIENVKNVVQKYDGEIELNCKENMFTCSILLYALETQDEAIPLTVKMV